MNFIEDVTNRVMEKIAVDWKSALIGAGTGAAALGGAYGLYKWMNPTIPGAPALELDEVMPDHPQFEERMIAKYGPKWRKMHPHLALGADDYLAMAGSNKFRNMQKMMAPTANEVLRSMSRFGSAF